MWNPVWFSAAAVGIWSSPTRLGMAADRVGASMPESPAATEVKANTGHSAGSAIEALTARPTLVSASPSWVHSSTLRRS